MGEFCSLSITCTIPLRSGCSCGEVEELSDLDLFTHLMHTLLCVSISYHWRSSVISASLNLQSSKITCIIPAWLVSSDLECCMYYMLLLHHTEGGYWLHLLSETFFCCSFLNMWTSISLTVLLKLLQCAIPPLPPNLTDSCWEELTWSCLVEKIIRYQL